MAEVRSYRRQLSGHICLRFIDDFGDDQYAEPFEALAGIVDRSALLSGVGRVMMHAQLLQLLKNRLLFADLLARHPEIDQLEVTRPIVICGLPRTGTTHLHNLMAADPALRSLPYWESLEPIPVPAEADADPDPRLARCEQGLAVPLAIELHLVDVLPGAGLGDVRGAQYVLPPAVAPHQLAQRRLRVECRR